MSAEESIKLVSICAGVVLIIAILFTIKGCAETELAMRSGYEQVVDPDSRQIIWKKAVE